MLKFLDKVLTRAIDWLYLKRTTVRLKIAAREAKTGFSYQPPYPELVEDTLAEYGLSVEQLGSTGGLYRAQNVDATRR